MQKQVFGNSQHSMECRLCGQQIPRINHKQHLKQCYKKSRGIDSSQSSDAQERRQRFFGTGVTQKARQTRIFSSNRHAQNKNTRRQCKHCLKKYPLSFIYQHQSFCHSNQQANQIRRQFSSSSDDADEHYNNSSSDQSIEKRLPQPVARPRQKESYFHHRPRRQYRLSQTSSQEDQSQKYWRDFHQNRIVASQDLCIRILNTTIDGINIVVTSNGQYGPVLKRVVYNQRTGQRKQISEHRYLRHYAMHTIDPYRPNTMRNQQTNNIFQNISPQLETQLQEALQRLTVSMNQLQEAMHIQRGLTEEEISLFQKRSYKKCSQQSETCAICHQAYEESDFVISLKCFHFFHQACIVEWLEKKPNCPLCKTKQN